MKRNYRRMDAGTLFTYVLLAMVFAIGSIFLFAVIFQCDVLAWNHTLFVSIFFMLTGGICGMFLLGR